MKSLASGWCTWILWAVLALPLPGGAQTRGFVPEDYYRLKSVGEVEVSPTGEYVAFTVTSIVEEENRRHREIWLQPLSGGRPDGAPFPFTDPTYESSGPRWSPDGSVLAFTSRRGDDANPIWFKRVDRGGSPYHIEGVVGPPVWSPDGAWIAFVREPGAGGEEEASPREGWIAPDAISRTLDPERFDGRVITSTRYKRNGVLTLLPHPSVEEKEQLFVVASSGGEARQLTDLEFEVDDPAWGSDSRGLYFTGDENEDDELSLDSTEDIWYVRVSGGTVRRLTTNPGSETSPAVAPDGGRIAYLSTRERGAQTEVVVRDLGSDGGFLGSADTLTLQWDLDPGSPQWSADGARVRWEAQIGGDRHLFRAPIPGTAPGAEPSAAARAPTTEAAPPVAGVEQVTRGARRLSDFSFSTDGSVMAYVATDAVTPAELYVASGDGATEQKATTLNDALLRELILNPAERLIWRVADGTEVEGWVVKPVGYREGTRYPLVLKIHGGPHSSYGNTFFPTFHVLSNAGFFVLYTNPRGSSGYGQEFKYATRGEWGIVDKEDYLAGLDAALAKYSDADSTRLGVSGGSYGGFMTNWLTATTGRFHAAVTSRSISNWESWWGTTDVPTLTEWEFYGLPWEERARYRRLSPISYVENVNAPTLIIHSEEDWRTPIPDAEQWFVSLKKLGVPTELVRYPRSTHDLSRTGEPWLLVDRLERIRSWFVHWLVDHPPGRRAEVSGDERRPGGARGGSRPPLGPGGSGGGR